MESDMICVAVADDHEALRAGICHAISAKDEMSVVAEYPSAHHAVQNIARHTPDVLVLDINMPGLNGIDSIPRLKQASPTTSIIVFTMHEPANYAVQAFKAGVSGYVTKGSPIATLLEAIQVASKGKKFIPSNVAEVLADSVASQDLDLTVRETEVLRLFAEGLNGNEIAKQLNISTKTVSSHKAAIMAKIGIKSDVDLVIYAIKTGLKKI